MRIIAGQLGGRQFDSPKGRQTHPMSDKMRGALFNALGDIEGLTFLDAFAGSGAVGIEAVSRNAGQVVAIEKDKSAHTLIEHNIRKLAIIGRLKAIQASIISWSKNNSSVQFDVIVADPPYQNLQLPAIDTLIRHLRPHGVLVLSWPGKLVLPELPDMTAVKQLSLGDAQLVFYRSLTADLSKASDS